MDLRPSYINRDDVSCTVLQQAISEPSGGRANVDTSLARHVNPERVESVFELECTAAHEPAGLARELDRIASGDLPRRLVDWRAVDSHAAIINQRRCFAARLDKPSSEQLFVNPNSRHRC